MHARVDGNNNITTTTTILVHDVLLSSIATSLCRRHFTRHFTHDSKRFQQFVLIDLLHLQRCRRQQRYITLMNSRSKTKTMERASSDPSELTLLWIIDYGTKTMPIGAQIRRTHQKPAPGKTSILRLQDQQRQEAPQIVGYVQRNGSNTLEFVWGYELSKLRQSTNKDACVVVAVFERLKLAILGSGKEAVAAKQCIEDQLRDLGVAEKSAEDLFVRHLVALKPAISAAVAKEFNFPGSSQTGKMAVRVFFAAPEIAELGKLHNLSKLLKQANFPETTLVPEAEAAGAWHAFRYCSGNLGARVSDQAFAPGAGHIVCDVGGWTCNISSFTMTGSPEDGARMGMKASGRMESTYYIS